MEENSGSLRLVLFPWLAFGHMHPFLELSKQLASRGHHIAFISTPRNIQRLPRIPSHLSSLITFVPLALPHVEQLPENAESAEDITQEHTRYLEKAFDGLAVPFLSFLTACSDESTKPDWIITDTHHHWLPRIAKDFSIPCAMFCPIPVSSCVFFGPLSEYIRPSRTAIEHLTVPPSWIPFPSKLAYRPHEARWLMTITKESASGISFAQRVQSNIMESEFICFRACYELESKWISILTELFQKDIVPMGSLLPPVEENSSSRESKLGSELEFDAVNWLNNYPPKSVLYIALGSQANLSIELLHELAFGLKKAGVPFLWALRKPISMSGSATDMLPEGFQEQIKGYGYVAAGWVPQVTLLAHASIGAFLTHCGPGSVIESLQFGHPLVMLPLFFEQGLNARVLEERGVGVEVPRDAETGHFDREGVARTIRLVMVEEEGRLIRGSAEQVQSIYTDKISQEKHLDGLIKRLQKHA